MPKPGEGGMGIYPPNNLTASSPIIWLWSTSKRWMMFGPFFGLHEIPGKKLLNFQWRPFFLRFIPPMLKLGQNWGKIANYPPKCSTKMTVSYSTVIYSHWKLEIVALNHWSKSPVQQCFHNYSYLRLTGISYYYSSNGWEHLCGSNKEFESIFWSFSKGLLL